MSRFRRAAKIDSAQPEIVEGLRARGIDVWIVGYPVDLLLWFWCERHCDRCFMLLEIKSPTGKKAPKARFRQEQKEQNEFLERTNTPAVISLDGALFAINARHRLESVHLQTSIRPLEPTCPPPS